MDVGRFVFLNTLHLLFGSSHQLFHFSHAFFVLCDLVLKHLLLSTQLVLVLVDATDSILLELDGLALQLTDLPILVLDPPLLCCHGQIALSVVSGELGNLVLSVFLCHLSFFLDLLVFNAHVVQFSQQSGILLRFILTLVIRELQLEVQVSCRLGRLLKLLL